MNSCGLVLASVRAWDEEDTGAPCRRAHAAVCAKGGGRHQEPNPLFQVLPEAADGEGHDRKNRSGQSEIAQTGVQAGMSYYINNTMSIGPFAPHLGKIRGNYALA